MYSDINFSGSSPTMLDKEGKLAVHVSEETNLPHLKAILEVS
jgi:hypothetical protein